MRLLLLFITLVTLTGCFWKSSPPDLNNDDRPIKLVVLWDRVISDERLERSSWSTTDEDRLASLTALLDTESWKSSSVLPVGHSTRIILTMRSGKIWEICQSTGKNRSLKMFDRHDRGWSGRVDWSDAFLQELTSTIESETGYPVNLSKEYRQAISNGTLVRTVAHATQKQLNSYPGYPEMIWNKAEKKFEYAR